MKSIAQLLREIWIALIRGKAGVFYLVIIFIIIFVGGNIVFYVASTFPASCKTCHYMKPYYDQWLTSNHSDIDCLKCHKFRPVANMVNTLKYLTNNYNPRPIARIEDDRCLQENCHPQQSLKGEVQYKESILFDHREHLEKIKRIGKLKCVSCHSQIVQGEHIAVTKKVCYLCHFRGAPKGQSVTGCPSCHGIPTKIVEHEGFFFSHESYLKIGVACNQCHIDIVSGTGDVPLENCHSCHVERAEMAENTYSIHQIHVSGTGINCFHCHDEIEHGNVRLIQALEIRCENCHPKLHSPQKELYMGASGLGVSDTPSRMFAAQVACDGCHRDILEIERSNLLQESRVRKGKGASCVECHGKGYDLMLNDWIREGKRLLREVKPALTLAGKLIRGARAKEGKDIEEARTLYKDAQHNFDLVQYGLPSHNIDYSFKLLKATWDQSHFVIKIINPARLSSLSAEPEMFQNTGKYCTTFCHDRLGVPEELTYREMDIDFPHALHADFLEISCADCHSPEKHKMRIITKEGCMECHHGGEEECGRCHHMEESFYSGRYKSHFTEPQADFMFEAELPCTACHNLSLTEQNLMTIKQTCIDCHDQEYGTLLIEWEKTMEEADITLTLLMDSIEKKLKSATLSKDQKEALEKQFRAISSDYEVLREGRALHNFIAATDIYENVTEKLKEMEKLLDDHQR